MLRRHFIELVLLASAGAFAVLLAELAILGHGDGIQLVAPIAATTGIAASLLAVVLRGPFRALMAIPLVLVAIAGLVGAYRHLDERDAELPLLTAPVALAHDGDDHDDDSSGPGSGDEDDDHEDEHDHDDDDDDDHEPPPLAPLGLSGNAALALLATIAGAAPPRRDA